MTGRATEQMSVADPVVRDLVKAAQSSLDEIAADARRLLAARAVLAALPAEQLLTADDGVVLDALTELDVSLTLLAAKALHVRDEWGALVDVTEGYPQPGTG